MSFSLPHPSHRNFSSLTKNTRPILAPSSERLQLQPLDLVSEPDKPLRTRGVGKPAGTRDNGQLLETEYLNV